MGTARAKVQRLERSDCNPATERAGRSGAGTEGAPGECCAETRELAWGSVVLGFAGIWILHDEQVYFRHSEGWLCLPFIFHHSGALIPSSSLFPKTQCG